MEVPAGIDGRVKASSGEKLVRRLGEGALRGAVAAMAMTGLRQVTTGFGLVEQTPPDAILKQRAFGPIARYPGLAYFVARRQVGIVELAHWCYGAGAGAAYAMLPLELSGRRWSGPAYGALTWLTFELSIAPLLGLEQATRFRAVERLMFATDHVVFGALLADDRRWLQRGRQARAPWKWV